jgi:hypothetical protein
VAYWHILVAGNQNINVTLDLLGDLRARQNLQPRGSQFNA